MPGHLRTFVSAFGIMIPDLFIVLAVFSAIGTVVTAAPPSSGPKHRTTDANQIHENQGYTFGVDGAKTSSHYSEHSRASNGGTAQKGRYETTYENGRTQIVTYTADENGYRAVVKWADNKDGTSVRAPVNVKAPSSGSAGILRQRSSECNVLPNPGECRGAFPRFFYNSNSSHCDCFLYGGCDDEQPTNSWLTFEDCTATCSPDKAEPGPRCKIASKPEIQTFTTTPVIAEAADTSHISDKELLDLFA